MVLRRGDNSSAPSVMGDAALSTAQPSQQRLHYVVISHYIHLKHIPCSDNGRAHNIVSNESCG